MITDDDEWQVQGQDPWSCPSSWSWGSHHGQWYGSSWQPWQWDSRDQWKWCQGWWNRDWYASQRWDQEWKEVVQDRVGQWWHDDAQQLRESLEAEQWPSGAWDHYRLDASGDEKPKEESAGQSTGEVVETKVPVVKHDKKIPSSWGWAMSRTRSGKDRCSAGLQVKEDFYQIS